MRLAERRLVDLMRETDRREAATDAQVDLGYRLMSGEVLCIFGKPVDLTWPEGRPFGMSEEELRNWALEQLRKRGSRPPTGEFVE